MGQLIERAKHVAEKLTGVGRPSPAEAHALVRPRKANTHLFADDGETPNNPALPLIHYRSPVRLPDKLDPAAVFEVLFGANGWGGSWRDGVYPFEHFHTATHEVLGIARGEARVRVGGAKGRVLTLKAGDVIVQPAGTGHKRMDASDDLLVVGAYPANGGDYDEPRPGEADRQAARAAIAATPLPETDPVYGRNGPLRELWAR